MFFCLAVMRGDLASSANVRSKGTTPWLPWMPSAGRQTSRSCAAGREAASAAAVFAREPSGGASTANATMAAAPASTTCSVEVRPKMRGRAFQPLPCSGTDVCRFRALSGLIISSVVCRCS